MEARSRGVWMSARSGPKDTASSSGILADRMPHSNPAWMVSTLGSLPYCSLKTATMASRRGEFLRYSQAG